jgi:hypothetical protein
MTEVIMTQQISIGPSPKQQKRRWRPKRFVIGLLLYWFACMGGAGLLVRIATQGGIGSRVYDGGWIILITLIMVAVCMITEIEQKKLWERILVTVLSVLIAYIAWTILIIPLELVVGLFIPHFSEAERHIYDRANSFIVCLPIVIWTMKRSRLFMMKHEGA